MTRTYRPIEDRSDLSAYEKLRMQNIIRNNAKLRSLGLISEAEERKSNSIAQGIEDYTNNDEENNGSIDKIDKKRRKRESSIPMREGSRKSRRLQKLDVEIKTPSLPAERESSSVKDIEKERMDRIKECRQVRLRAAKAIADAGAEKASKENPTASYEHCLMRVKTMTPKKLENRIRVIERAAGKFCVVKMAIFKSCLQDEGMWDLAELASVALERLKALKEPV